MNDETRAKIEEIMTGMQCPKNFKCADGGFKSLCKAKYLGLEDSVECLQEHPPCHFHLAFKDGYFCRCPLRVYLAKELEKQANGATGLNPT